MNMNINELVLINMHQLNGRTYPSLSNFNLSKGKRCRLTWITLKAILVLPNFCRLTE